MHLHDHGIDIVQLFNPFQKVMAQMKKKVDRLSLQILKPTQRRGMVVFWQPTKWNGQIEAHPKGGMVCFGNLLNGMVKLKPTQRGEWCVFGNQLNGMVNIGIMDG
jgi:hypothetical protein